jgi:hypothetical protein
MEKCLKIILVWKKKNNQSFLNEKEWMKMNLQKLHVPKNLMERPHGKNAFCWVFLC